VIIPYMAIPASRPIPSLGGSLFRHRPILAVRLAGPAGMKVRDGLLDTGSDDTVFDDSLAGVLGVDLRQAEERMVGLAGRPTPVRCRYAAVELRISDGVTETYEWSAIVGFVAGPLHYNLLGHAGFLQYFRSDFDGEARLVTIIPKPSFPGRRI
jgi:hypothetical protein